MDSSKKPILNWMIGGKAGYGIFTTGRIFSKCMTRGGYNTFDYKEYPSLIRGGHQNYHVSVSKEEIFSPYKKLDILIALDELTIKRHQNRIKKDGVLLYDSQKVKEPETAITRKDIVVIPVPLEQIARKISGSPVMRNTAAVGAALALIKYELEIFNGIMKDTFSRKGEAVVKKNIETAMAGADYINKNFKDACGLSFQPLEKKGKLMVVSGNQAVAMGAIKGGCKFFAAYPMTPASSILSYMAKYEFDYNIVVKQAEDEIAVINMAIGAGHAGARSFTATSGGGFALMAEGYGLAAMTETPVVIVVVSRPGPATGLPTWNAQGDLSFVLSAAPDDFPRVVIAPGDMQESFFFTHQAFNLAEKYQTPVIILSDKFLGESHKSEMFFDTSALKVDRGHILTQKEVQEIQKASLEEEFTPQNLPLKRYQYIDAPVSPRIIPGTKGAIFCANSDEHDEYGFSNEEPENKTKMTDKRHKKLIDIKKNFPGPKWYGPKGAKTTVICWGSTKLTVLEAMKHIPNKEVNILHFTHISPLPIEKVTPELKKIKKSIVVECNKTGQLNRYLKEQTGYSADDILTKYDGRMFFPCEIAEALK